jgi:hypothetical protein
VQSHLGPARRCSLREPIAFVARAIQTRREAADEGDRIA